MKRSRIYFFVSVLLIFLIGCGGTGQLMKNKKSTEGESKSSGVINESYNPPTLDESDLKLEQTISIDSKSDNIDELLINETKEESPEEVDGFRVQICAVSDENKARNIQKDAILEFIDEDIYLRYDSPYYKVRVGNCTTRYEAELLQKKAVAKGFTDAWVVRTKVKPKSNESKPQQNITDEPPN